MEKRFRATHKPQLELGRTDAETDTDDMKPGYKAYPLAHADERAKTIFADRSPRDPERTIIIEEPQWQRNIEPELHQFLAMHADYATLTRYEDRTRYTLYYRADKPAADAITINTWNGRPPSLSPQAVQDIATIEKTNRLRTEEDESLWAWRARKQRWERIGVIGDYHAPQTAATQAAPASATIHTSADGKTTDCGKRINGLPADELWTRHSNRKNTPATCSDCRTDPPTKREQT